MYRFITCRELPVSPCVEKQMTTSFWVLPSGMPPTALINAMDACSVPWKGAVVPFTAVDLRFDAVEVY